MWICLNTVACETEIFTDYKIMRKDGKLYKQSTNKVTSVRTFSFYRQILPE